MGRHAGKGGDLVNKLDIHAFGEQLIVTRDLDPLYVGLVEAKLPKDQLYRYLLTYWMFYHVGLSACLSEFEEREFWDSALVAAENKDHHGPGVHGLPGLRWPRGSERRHFRGVKCVQAVQTLAERFPKPEDAVRSLLKKQGDYVIMETVRTWPMFGEWIAFKVVDMLERCAGVKCPVSSDLILMYDEPYKALEILAKDQKPEQVFDGLLAHFAQFQAPPRGDRPCGPQEVETILCKVKSHWNGHYWVGKDIHEHRAALKGWGETADQLLRAYPKEVNRDLRRVPNTEPEHGPELRGFLF